LPDEPVAPAVAGGERPGPEAATDQGGGTDGARPTTARATNANGPVALGQVAGARKRRRARHRRRAAYEWAIAIALAILVALVIKTWVAQAFVIPTGSMERTLLVHDRVLVSKLSYRFGDIGRGDVIVFDNPSPRPGDPAQLIKRVVGLPGDRIAASNGQLVVNGEPQVESYVRAGARTRLDSCPLYRADETVVVPPGHLFVMGDNREQSHDARCFGPITEDSVVGKAFLRIWPIGRIGRL
jgi:signal peptidase I